MYVWYTKKFHGGYSINTSHGKPPAKNLSGVEPLHVQKVSEEHMDESLDQLKTLYPPEKQEA